MFENRSYRQYHKKKGLTSFNITVKETNLNIQADADLTQLAIKSVLEIRNYLETHIAQHPDFSTSLVPVLQSAPVQKDILAMIEAGKLANVGPMAAVAGTIAAYTGQKLLTYSKEILVENGGDIFVKSNTDTTFSIYAADSPFSMTCGIRIEKRDTPYGLCTSSGTLGHSKSFGKADAVVILSDSCPLADAAATALGNTISHPGDIQAAIDSGKKIPGIQGIVIIKNDSIGAWGDIELVNL